jgi:acyl-CoA thioesterase FadM
MNPAEQVLLDAGYRWSAAITATADDFDAQGHLNNAAVARYCNDLRVGYVRTNLGAPWLEWLRDTGSVIAAREVHLSYESEGFPNESFIGATRILRRDGKAVIIEQMVIESGGRVVARAWVVQLVVRDGRAVEWPDFYWPLVETTEGRPIPHRPSPQRPPFGPPPWDNPPDPQ